MAVINEAEVMDALHECYDPEIPLNIEVEYAHQNEQSVLTFAPKSLGAAAYFHLTEEVMQL